MYICLKSCPQPFCLICQDYGQANTDRNPPGDALLISVVRLFKFVILVVSDVFTSDVKFSKIFGLAIGSLYVNSVEKKHP